ncbi:MAG: hypothetical protein ACRD2J_11260 [Thermoanaerobaculia bacterium]
MTDADEVCFGCGLSPVVQVNDRKLCGNCFLLGISVSLQKTVNEAAQLEHVAGQRGTAHVQELRSTLQVAIDEIQRLRDRLETLIQENAKLRDRE